MMQRQIFKNSLDTLANCKTRMFRITVQVLREKSEKENNLFLPHWKHQKNDLEHSPEPF